jgi:hypothetical protein
VLHATGLVGKWQVKQGAGGSQVGQTTASFLFRETQCQKGSMEKATEVQFDVADDSFLVRDSFGQKQMQVDPMT